jgi:HD-like signal output (HDOD) protein
MSKLLLVESDAAYGALFQAVVEVLGQRAERVASFDEARQVLSGGRWSGVLVTWDPSDGSGLAFVRWMRSVPGLQPTPVVLLAGAVTRAQVADALTCGIQGILLKPAMTIATLRATVRRLGVPTGAGTGIVVRPGARLSAGQAQASPAAGADEASAPLPESNAGAEDVESGAGEASAPSLSLSDMKPIVRRSELTERLRAIEQMKALPPTVTQVVRMTQNPNCSIDALTSVISRDQNVSLDVLKLANSAVYSRGDPVTSVKDSIVRIGLDRIREAVISLGVIERFGSESLSARFNFLHFWEHSICCGLIAGEIGEITGEVSRDEAFTLGLLHDLGRLILAEHLPSEYERVLDAAQELDLPLERVESRMLLLNHAGVLDRVLLQWGFPRNLVEPMMHHHLSAGNLREHAGKHLVPTAVLALANRLTHALLIGSSGNDAVYDTEALCRLLKLGGDEVSRVVEFGEKHTQEMKLSLLQVAHGQPWPRVDASYRERLAGDFRPLYVGDDAGIDAFRLTMDRLSGGTEEGDGAPTVAVVRLEHKRQVSRLARDLAERERSLGLDPLPTLVLAPTADLGLEDATPRRVLSVATPLTMRRLVEAINALAPAEAAAQGAAA